jgi:hypothetical protein
MARSLSEALLSSLPPFWKIAKDYMDGRFKKVTTGRVIIGPPYSLVALGLTFQLLTSQSESMSYDGA